MQNQRRTKTRACHEKRNRRASDLLPLATRQIGFRKTHCFHALEACNHTENPTQQRNCQRTNRQPTPDKQPTNTSPFAVSGNKRRARQQKNNNQNIVFHCRTTASHHHFLNLFFLRSFFFHFLAVRAFLRTGGFSPSLDSSSSSFSDDASSCTWFPAKRRLRRGRTARGAAAGRRAVDFPRRDRAFPVGRGLGLAFALGLGLGLGFPRTRPTLLSRNGASHVSLRFPGLASTSSPAAVSEYSSSSLPSNRMFSSSSAGGLFGDGPHTLSTDAGNWPTLYVISCRYHLSAPARPTRPSSTGQK